jgi:hypothetical protein
MTAHIALASSNDAIPDCLASCRQDTERRCHGERHPPECR